MEHSTVSIRQLDSNCHSSHFQLSFNVSGDASLLIFVNPDTPPDPMPSDPTHPHWSSHGQPVTPFYSCSWAPHSGGGILRRDCEDGSAHLDVPSVILSDLYLILAPRSMQHPLPTPQLLSVAQCGEYVKRFTSST